jgi:hypothetical protein
VSQSDEPITYAPVPTEILCELFGVNADWPCVRVSWSVVCAVEVQLRARVNRPVLSNRVAFADDSLMMITDEPLLGRCARCWNLRLCGGRQVSGDVLLINIEPS